jgi:hypothetical protein
VGFQVSQLWIQLRKEEKSRYSIHSLVGGLEEKK